MALIIGSRPVFQPAGLSQPALLVLSCIDGGNEWLAHAIQSPRLYAFEDEMALVVGAQHGLHGTPLVLLPKLELMAGAARLIALSAADLHLLMRVESGSGDAAAIAAAQGLLTGEALHTASDLAAVDAMLKSLGVAGASLFQALTLSDRLALLALKAELAADGAPGASAQKAAARFAADWAYAPVEFADYLRAYLTLTTGAAPLAADAARAALAALAPMLFDTLDCPAVTGFVAPEAVAMAVAAWLREGRRIGFPRLSRGVWQLVVHGGYRGETGKAGLALVNAHLDQAHALLSRASLDRATLSQDGGTAHFTACEPDKPGEVGLQLDALGAITLDYFVPA